MKNRDAYSTLKFRPCEVVRVKSYAEISGTLRKDGALDGLPFQAEMQKYCGQTFRVLRPAKKLIIENSDTGLRGIKNTAILDDVVCDGAAHGGCSRSCFLLWKESWLTRADGQRQEAPRLDERRIIEGGNTVQTLAPAATTPCQSISLIKATYSLSRWSFKPYIWDITENTSQLPRKLGLLTVSLVRRVLSLFRVRLPNKLINPQERTPSAEFVLQSGDLVEVKSFEEIRTTLDYFGKNRGLAFTNEMKRFCGRRLAVRKPVDQIIVEGTGEMRRISHTVILNNGLCDGSAHSWCARNCYLLWRKVWLRKI
jgi:hypothetical protein